MKFRRSAPAVLVGAAAVVMLLTALVSNRLFSGMTDSVEQSQFDMMEAILEFNLESAQKRALARAEMLADLPATKRLLANRDRDGLSAEYLAMFEGQRDKHGIDQMHFYLAPATSFLRLHAPSRYGDDVSARRPMIVAANRDHVSSMGAGIGKTGPALYGAAPVFDPAGEPTGAFEIGIAFGPLLDNLKVAYDLEFALLVEAELLDPAGVAKEVFADDHRLGKYVKYHSTHWELMQQLVGAADLARVQDPVRYTRNALELPYGVVLVPLRDSTGTPLGVVAVAKNFEASRAAAGQSVVWQGLLALFAVVALAGVIQIVVRGFLLQPVEAITGRFAKLADGAPGKPIERAELLCTELKLLAAQHERLRVQAESRSTASPDQDGET
jgi:methyl-accepting chemotaxis protein